MILENLKTAGVQQAHKEDKITLTAHRAVARRLDLPRRVGTSRRVRPRRRCIGSRKASRVSLSAQSSERCLDQDLVAAAREAGDAGFDVLIACAFNYDAHSSEFRQARPHPGAQGTHERRPAHGGRPEEHR
jgi:adenine-specific DNA-methyltransferase